MTERTFVVRIFDGTNTTFYDIKEVDIFRAENKAIRFHTALGGSVIKVQTTDITNQR